MFSRFNNRITRSIIAAALPALVTFGFSGQAMADGNYHQPAQYAPQSYVLTYSGQANGMTITMTIDYSTMYGNSVEGTMTINGSSYAFVMDLLNSEFQGVVDTGDQQIPFTGSAQGETVYLHILDTQVVLQPGA